MWTRQTETVINNADVLDKPVLAFQAMQTSLTNTCPSNLHQAIKKKVKMCILRLEEYTADYKLFLTFSLETYMELVKLWL